MKAKLVLSVSGVVLLASAIGAGSPAPPATATISGKVTYTGTPPKMKPIDMAKEPSCAKQHATPGTAAEPATQVARYDQKGCQYLPHVLPMQTGQVLQIFNDDQTSHNIHPLAKVNPEWNKSQPAGSQPIDTRYDKPEFIPVKCNIHPWMHGYFVVLNTSHYAVTGQDGSFSLKGLPPGKYTVSAWQEQYGAQTQEVTITGAETKTVNFTFKALPY
jgi:plastocyanin